MSRVKSRWSYKKVEGHIEKVECRISLFLLSRVEICGQNNLFNVVTWTRVQGLRYNYSYFKNMYSELQLHF